MTRAAASAGILVALALLTACGEDSPGGACDPSATSGVSADVDALPAIVADSVGVTPRGDSITARCLDGVCRWDSGKGAGTDYDVILEGAVAAFDPESRWSVQPAGCAMTVVDDTGGHQHDLDAVGDAPDPDSLSDFVIDPRQKRVAATSDLNTVVVWDAHGEVVATRSFGSVDDLAFGPAGDRLAVSSNEGLAVLDSATGEVVTQIDRAGGGPVAWSPDGQWIAAGYSEISLLDADGLTVADTWSGGLVSGLAFSADSTRVAITPDDGTEVQAWAPGELGGDGRTRTFAGHGSTPEGVAFGPDGRRLYSAAADEVISWNVRTGQLIRRFDVPGSR